MSVHMQVAKHPVSKGKAAAKSETDLVFEGLVAINDKATSRTVCQSTIF